MNAGDHSRALRSGVSFQEPRNSKGHEERIPWAQPEHDLPEEQEGVAAAAFSSIRSAELP